MPHNQDLKEFKRFIEIIEKLRSPEGCPWDREQTHKTLRENLIEETYEAVDAIDSGNIKDLKEELGDVLLQVVLHAQIASEEGNFNIEDIAKEISDKIVRRHPHVFSDTKVNGTEEVLVNWDKIKSKEKPERKSALSGIAKSLPALVMAAKLSKKAVKVGFEWPSTESLWNCFLSEIDEFKETIEAADSDRMEDEFGDMLFCMVNIARWYKIDPEQALMRANRKFKTRFQLMEEIAPKNLIEYSIDELEEFWQLAKSKL